MRGKILCPGRILQYLLPANTVGRKNINNPEHAFGQGAGLVKHNGIHLVESFQKVTALHQHTVLGGGTDTAEKGQGNGDHQSTGTGYNQKHEGTADPFDPGGRKQHRRDHRQQCCQNYHRRGIVAGKGRDEILCGRFSGRGIFHHIDDLCHGRLRIGLDDLNGQKAGFIDAAGEDFVHGMHRPWHRFAGQRPGVHHRVSQQHHTVQGYLLAGLYHDPLAFRHILRRHCHQFSVSSDRCCIRADVH